MATGTVQQNEPVSERHVSLPEKSAERSRPTHPFAQRDFRRVWTGSFISLIGDQFYLVALPWLVLQITGSSVALGAILMIAAGPRAVLMLVGGATSDRSSPRRILLTTAWARFILVLIVGILVHRDLVQLWQLYALAALFGSADAFSYPAGQALIPSLVETEQLPSANSLIMASAQLSLIIGPLAAGLIMKRWGIAWAFLIDAFSFVALIGALMRIRKSGPGPTLPSQPDSIRASIIEGLRYVAGQPALRSLIVLSAATNFCLSGPLMVGLAILSKQQFGSAAAFGTFISALAFGSLAGAIGPALVKQQLHRGLILLTVFGLVGVGMILLGLLHSMFALAVTLVIMGAGGGWSNVSIQSWLQAAVDRTILGRVVSLLMFAMVGLAPFSYILAGSIVQASLRFMLISSGLLVLLIVAITAKHGSIQAIQ